MAANVGTTFVTGRDAQAVLIAPNGARFDLTNMTDFEITPRYKTASCEPLNQPMAERYLPTGHEFSFSIDRKDGTNDALFTAIESGWWNTGSADQGTGSNGSLTITTSEVSGGATVEQYAGVAVRMGKKGTFRQDSAIKQTITGFASRKLT